MSSYSISWIISIAMSVVMGAIAVLLVWDSIELGLGLIGVMITLVVFVVIPLIVGIYAMRNGHGTGTTVFCVLGIIFWILVIISSVFLAAIAEFAETDAAFTTLTSAIAIIAMVGVVGVLVTSRDH